jgi:hypothetical protein
MKQLPRLSIDLIAELDKLYPPKCIAPGETLEAAHRYAGLRELVDTLREMAQRDERKALEQRTKTKVT